MAIKTIKYKRNKHQKVFHADVKSKRLHMSTGFGGGKTHALIMKMFLLSKLNRNVSGGFMCPTYTDFTKDVKPLVEEICEMQGIPVNFHGVEHYYTWPWTTGKVYIVGAKARIRGPNWGFALINELTLCPLVRYKEVLGRVRVKRAKFPQVASVGTPEGMASEYYDYMIDKPRDNFRIIYGDTKDNLDNLTEDYVDNLTEDYDKIMQDAYIRGLWVNMSGNRFYYAYRPEKNDNENIKYNEYSSVHISMDFNVDPMSAVLWQYDGKKLRAYDEITIENIEDGADTKMMGKAIIARGYNPSEVILYPDPSGNNRSTNGDPNIVILRNMGFTDIRVRRKHPGFRQRQLNMNNLLEKGIIEIHPKKCPRLRKDFMSVEQDTVTNEKIKKNKSLTHHSDGADYMCDILFPFSGSRQRSRIEKVR